MRARSLFVSKVQDKGTIGPRNRNWIDRNQVGRADGLRVRDPLILMFVSSMVRMVLTVTTSVVERSW